MLQYVCSMQNGLISMYPSKRGGRGGRGRGRGRHAGQAFGQGSNGAGLTNATHNTVCQLFSTAITAVTNTGQSSNGNRKFIA